MAVQWLRLRASTSGGMCSIPSQGTKIPHAMQHSQKKEREREKQVLVLLNTLEVLSFGGGEVCDNGSGRCDNGFPPLSAHHDQKQQLVITQITQYLEHKVFIAHSGSHRSRNVCTASWYGTRGVLG